MHSTTATNNHITTVNNKNPKRSPWIAALLSFMIWGLGQVYCGRIAKGLLLLLIGVAIGPLFATLLILGHAAWHVYALLAFVLLLGAVWLYSVVDAFLTAMRTGDDYRLKDYNRWFVYVFLALLSLPISCSYALLIREGFYEAFRVVSPSMLPTLQQNDRVLVDKRAYRWEPLRRGDLVVFIHPNKRQQHCIKRVVALPGDSVEMRDRRLYVNGEPLSLTKDSGGDAPSGEDAGAEVFWESNGPAKYRILLSEAGTQNARPSGEFPQKTIPSGQCFLLGDHRSRCCDSRHFGPISLVDIVGRVECIYCPRWVSLRQ